ncbi:MAG: hypothetical protein ACFB2Z_00455, partial [Maricaulaceae bacterium]
MALGDALDRRLARAEAETQLRAGAAQALLDAQTDPGTGVDATSLETFMALADAGGDRYPAMLALDANGRVLATKAPPYAQTRLTGSVDAQGWFADLSRALDRSSDPQAPVFGAPMFWAPLAQGGSGEGFVLPIAAPIRT